MLEDIQRIAKDLAVTPRSAAAEFPFYKQGPNSQSIIYLLDELFFASQRECPCDPPIYCKNLATPTSVAGVVDPIIFLNRFLFESNPVSSTWMGRLRS